MDFDYRHRRFAEFSDEVSIRGEVGLGIHRIVFGFRVDYFAREGHEHVEVVDLQADLALNRPRRHVGVLRPLGRRGFRTASTSGNTTVEFALDSRRLHHLADALESGPVAFDVAIFGLVRGPRDDVASARTTGRVTGSRKQWVAALQSAGFARTLTTEIVVPEADGDPKLKQGVVALQKALQLRFAGEPRQSVGHCRIAMDEAGLDKSLQVNFGKGGLAGLTFDERVKLVRLALFAFCSPPQHEMTDDYDGDEARLASTLTAALLEYEARKRERR